MGDNPIRSDDRPRKGVLRGRKLKNLDTGLRATLAVGAWEHEEISLAKPTQKQACATFVISMFPFSIVRHATEEERKDLIAGGISFAELRNQIQARNSNGNGRAEGSGNGLVGNKMLDQEAVFALLDQINDPALVLAWLDRITKPTK